MENDLINRLCSLKIFIEYLCYESEESMLYNEVRSQLYKNNMHRKRKAKKEIHRNFNFVLGGWLWVSFSFSFYSLNFIKLIHYLSNTQNASTTSFKSQTKQNLTNISTFRNDKIYSVTSPTEHNHKHSCESVRFFNIKIVFITMLF